VPIYEYRCRGCSKEFELLVLTSTVIVCPSCQSQELDQLLSGFAVSSEGSRRANVQAAQRANLNSNDFRERKVAETEYVKKHADE
jgi:putative FmdB family regulatory protein